MRGLVRVLPDADQLAGEVSAVVADRVRTAVAERGRATLVLTGGSTPRYYHPLLVEPLAEAGLRDSLHLFWGDERWVPPDHPDSNYRLARETLLEDLDPPAGHVHRVPTESGSPAEAARRYESGLRDFFGVLEGPSPGPLFDVVLLGVGEDGHIASLFPGDPLLEEQVRWVREVVGPPERPPRERVTLTLPQLAAARTVVLSVAGEGKRGVLTRLFDETDPAGRSLPVGRLEPAGELLWLVDRAAAPKGW